nr:carbohydrate kinase family protein [uncultured Agathobaculum sp.]
MSFVATVGSVNIDLMYSGLPRLPQEGEELFAKGFSLQMGGGSPATLINLAGLGVPVKISTWLGEDMFSAFAKSYFAQEGITPCNLYTGTGIPLNISTVLITPSDRTIASYTDGYTIDEKTAQRVYENAKGAKIVQMIGAAELLDVYTQLKREGAVLVFDTGWEDDLSIEKYRKQLDIADYYTPNQKEALKITNTDTPDEAAKVLSDLFENVIVKLDQDGCLIMENGTKKVIPNLEVEARDSTGAGDAFLAGLMYGLYHGYSFEDSVIFGNVTGAKCVTGIGCLTARCDEKELHVLAENWRSKTRG